ncbi:MAG: hypothetical protein LKJ88_07030 [Bacilli bacterium]|jgi:hypothetical protein|nr:hypothetical protein [Bacilli bacterium]
MKKIFGVMALSLLLLAGCNNSSSSLATATSSSKDSSSVALANTSSSEVVWNEQLSDGGLTINCPDQLSLYQTGYEYNPYFDIKINYDWQNTTQVSLRELESSDTSIIPQEALSFTYENSRKTGLAIDLDVRIQLKNVLKTGVVYIKIHLKSDNVSSEGTIIKKLTVVPFGEVEAPVYHETVKLDWTKVPVDNVQSIIFQLADKDFQYGLKNPNITDTAKEYQDFWQIELKDETTKKKDIDFTYFVGHRYTLIFQVKTTGGALLNYTIPEVVGEGDSTTGFNQFKNYYLTFAIDNSSIQLTVINQTYL